MLDEKILPLESAGESMDCTSLISLNRARFIIPELLNNQYIAKFITSNYPDWIPQLAGGKSLCYVIDFQGYGWSNIPRKMDWNLIKLAFSLFGSIPSIVSKVIFYDPPRMFMWIYHVMKHLAPDKIRHLMLSVYGEGIIEHISQEMLPYFITGVDSPENNCRPQIPLEAVDAETSMKMHGVEMKVYEKRIKPMLKDFVCAEFTRFPKILAPYKHIVAEFD